ncbi:hypothetical protein GC173_06550 [bacterium]|nr:hypothetical protein [bacterium]
MTPDPTAFTQIASDEFSFLLGQGYNRSRCEPGLVRFESDCLAIEILLDARSSEMELYVQFVRDPGASYSLGEFLALGGRECSYRAFMATSSTMTLGIKRLANQLRDLPAALLPDNELPGLLQGQRRDLASKLSLETRLQHAISAAEIAWKAKDFGAIVELLSPLREHLSESETAKLMYCKSRLS